MERFSTIAGDTGNPAGVGEEPSGPLGDGGPALKALVVGAQHLTFGSDGSLYFAEPTQGRIRRIGPDGIISTVVGDGRNGCGLSITSHEGEVASDVSMCFVDGFTLLLDGDLVFADQDRLWRVHAGRVSHFAGNGEVVPADIGDGGPATEAALENVADLLTDREGSVYVAEDLAGRVRVISPDGKISSLGEHLGGATDLLFTDSGDILVASVGGGVLELSAEGSITQLIPGYLGSRSELEQVLVPSAPGDDIALDAESNLYVSVNVIGYGNVLRISSDTLEDV
jgi:hypothetical protein